MPTDTADPQAIDALAISNLAFAEDLYYQYLQDPAAVDPAWRAVFERLDGAPRPANGHANGAAGNGHGASALIPPTAFPRSIFAATAPVDPFAPSPPGAIASRTSVRLLSERVQRLVEAYRELGHLWADLDPLGLMPRQGQDLALEDYGLAAEDLDLVFSTENVAGPDRTTLRGLIQLLRETYCRKMGVELAHLHDLELRAWLQKRMESTRNRVPLSRGDRLRRCSRSSPPKCSSSSCRTSSSARSGFRWKGPRA
jgi:2-oxoglutarate dehydrogenase E1 component